MPANIPDEELKRVASFRSRGRIPVSVKLWCNFANAFVLYVMLRLMNGKMLQNKNSYSNMSFMGIERMSYLVKLKLEERLRLRKFLESLPLVGENFTEL